MNETRFVNAEYRRFVWVVAMALLLLVVPKPSWAQSTGTILGTVKDSSGGVVPQAKVTLVNTDTNDTRTATTGDDGSFRFPALVTGHYTVRVEREGFKTQTQTGLTLEVTQELVVNTALQVGTSTQEVTVTGEAPVVNTTNASLGGLVNESKMADLPLNGRNYTDLTFMQPGVSIVISASSSTAIGGTHGTAFSSDGGSARANLYTLDGANMTNARGDATSGDLGTTLGVAGIKEYKVVTGAFDASYGNSPAAQVVMVSKGGSNQLHGELFEYLRNDVLDAANFFDKPVAANNFERIPPFQRNNFGASAGGPIKKDKTFVYAAYEGLRQRFGATISDTVPAAGCHGAAGAVITNTACPQLGSTASVTIASVVAGNGVAGSTGILGLYPVPDLPNNGYTFPAPSPSQEDWGQIRVDENISVSDTLFGRYTEDKSYSISAEGLSAGPSFNAGAGYPEFLIAAFGFNQYATIGENHIFSPTVLNQFRFSYARTEVNGGVSYPEGSLVGPAYSMVAGQPLGQLSVSALSSGLGSTGFPNGQTDNVYTLNEDVYYTRGKHALRFGATINRFNLAPFQDRFLYGGATFTSLASFLKGQAASFEAAQGGANAIFARNWWYWVPGFYAQDDWRVSPRLTLNLGLRYEFMSESHETNGRGYALRNLQSDATFTNGSPFAPFPKDHFSPRVGFAWDVMGDGKTSVRGGFGQYFDIGNLVALFYSGKQNEPPLAGLFTHTSSTTIMTLPLTISSTDQLGMCTTDYNLNNPYMLKWNLTVERQLPGGTGLQVAYVGTRGVHLYEGIEGNPVPPSAVVNGLPYWNGTGSRINPNFSTSVLETTGSASMYNALQVALNKRVSHGLTVQAAYTWSHALDDTSSQHGTAECSGAAGMTNGDYFGSGQNVFDKGPSCSDITQNVRVNILYHIPNIKSDNFAAKMEHGWWAGIIWSAQTGYAFTPVLGSNRSQSTYFSTGADYANVATAADAANCPSTTTVYAGVTCKFVPVAFNHSTVTEGDPAQWYNPNMFVLSPVVTTAGGTTVCTSSTCGTGTTYATLGNAQRGLLRGPGLDNLDFSINKDTRLPFLGEQGNLEFRAELFNIMNHPNFGMPNGTVFTGATSNYGPYSLAPSSSAGVVSSTVGFSREIQFALKVVF